MSISYSGKTQLSRVQVLTTSNLTLQDPEGYADASDLSEICQKLWCKSRSKTGYYAAGPALEGTKENFPPKKVLK